MGNAKIACVIPRFIGMSTLVFRRRFLRYKVTPCATLFFVQITDLILNIVLKCQLSPKEQRV